MRAGTRFVRASCGSSEATPGWSANRKLSRRATLANEYQHYPARKDLKEFFELGLRKIGAEKATEKTTAFLEDFPRNEVLRIPALRKFLRS